jgi:hypothetical protein
MRYQGWTPRSLALAGREGAPRPTTLELHLSPRCQLTCAYCHSISSWTGPSIYASPGETLLTVDEYRRLVGDFRALGGETVAVSGGGEPLLHPDAPAIIRNTAQCGVETHLYTNGLTLRRFDAGALDAWLPHLASVRFSIHADAWRSRRGDLLRAIDATLEYKDTRGLAAGMYCAMLVDAFPADELEDVLLAIAGRTWSGIELRTLLPGRPSAAQTLRSAEAFLQERGITPPLLDSRCAPIGASAVPQKCVALYRSVVVDPFGGVRLCCMRAHLQATDFSYVDNIRSTPLSECLAKGVPFMRQAGAGICDSCAPRDAEFAEAVVQSKER